MQSSARVISRAAGKRPAADAAAVLSAVQACTVCARARMLSSGATGQGSDTRSSRLPKFHTLPIPERVAALERARFLTADTRAALEGRGLALEDANNMIENVLATFGVPMVGSARTFEHARYS